MSYVGDRSTIFSGKLESTWCGFAVTPCNTALLRPCVALKRVGISSF